MKAQWLLHSANKLECYQLCDSVREQIKLGDLLLVITNGIHAALDHICHLPAEMPTDTMLQHTVSVPR